MDYRFITFEEKRNLRHSFAWLLLLFVWCFWTDGAHAADSPRIASEQPASSSEPGRLPSIAIPDDIHDFGEVMEGEQVVHDFVIKNTGDADLQIRQVRPG